MKLLTLSFLALVGFGSVADVAARPDPRSPLPAASWAPADTADSLWRAGRIAVADENWREAARNFERLTLRYPNSAYAGDALYWQAFALGRAGGSSDVRRAVRALEEQREKYPQSATFTTGEASALMTRLNGRLARSGDADAAASIAEVASAAAVTAVEAVAEAMPAVAAELERMGPEIRAEMQRELAAARAEMGTTERGRAAMARDAAQMSRDAARLRSGRGGDDIPAGCEDVVDDERIAALNALMQMNSDQALPVLRRVLERRDRCSEVLRRKAVFIVSQRRGDEAAEILLWVVRNDPDRATKSEAIFWLSQTNSERAVEVLEQILVKDAPDEELQKRAIFALSQTRSERAGTILRDFVRRRDVETELRSDAIFWLGQSNRGENSQFLRELFPTLENDELRERVIFSISQRRSEENSRWLLDVAKDARHSAEIRKNALFWASQSGGASVADLGAIYDSSRQDRELREQVIFALSQRRNDSAAVDKLLAIARTEEDRELRRNALFWLGQSRDPRAAAALEEIINKPR